ncbi:MAG: hypothetical protein ACPIOQ_15850, partial [Promethearchaeia archaeon]
CSLECCLFENHLACEGTMVAAPMMTWQASKGSPVGKARVRCLKHCSSCHDKQAQSTANQLTHVQVHGVEGNGV